MTKVIKPLWSWRRGMAQAEELIAIPKSEYEHLKRCEETLKRMLEAQIRDCEVKMQMMQIDTMIKQAIPPGIQVKQL